MTDRRAFKNIVLSHRVVCGGHYHSERPRAEHHNYFIKITTTIAGNMLFNDEQI